MNMQSGNRGRGFTLIELLVVIAIIGLLASVVMANLNSARAKARNVRRQADLSQIQRALEFYYDTNGRYPAYDGSQSGLPNCGGWALNHPSYMTCWNDLQARLAPYLSQLPVDPTPTNTPYHYTANWWYNGSGYVAFQGGVGQGFALLAYPEPGLGFGMGCWPGYYTVCVK
ncbi:prepilin-type N-terminal cleavage/methylation domain-containing protein [Candidatus Kaiserbacteria bacterium]|nr:prepilin-type N-terminal cleavage/methylation domain-containing protein [Candidatus Kaiserbacteria bacterium]